MNIILCGLPMSGKTTIGKKLAAKLNFPFVDTDHLIEENYIRPLSKPALFEKTVDFSADLSANFEAISKDMAEKLTDKDAKKSCFSEQMRFRKRSIQNTGKKTTCREIFLKEGERYFRLLEKQAIFSLKDVSGTVISTGGGSLDDVENREIVKQMGFLVYLKAMPQIIYQRLEQHSLPPYLNSEHPENAFYEIADRRMLAYENAACMTIETMGLTEDEIAEIICAQGLCYGK